MACFARSADAGYRTLRAKASGFTLIELVVVLVLLAVVLAVAAPALQAGLRSRELANSIREIATLCRSARHGAVVRAEPLDVAIVDDGRRVELDEAQGVEAMTEEDAGEAEPGAEPREPLHVELPDSVVIAAVEGGLREPPWDPEAPVRLRFFPNGSSSGLRLVLANREDPQRFRYELVVDPIVGTIAIGVPGEGP